MTNYVLFFQYFCVPDNVILLLLLLFYAFVILHTIHIQKHRVAMDTIVKCDLFLRWELVNRNRRSVNSVQFSHSLHVVQFLQSLLFPLGLQELWIAKHSLSHHVQELGHSSLCVI